MGARRKEKKVSKKGSIHNLAHHLLKLAKEQVSAKVEIEERWIDDTRQYHGMYDSQTEARLRAGKKSRSFVRLTKSKTDGWSARLADMLFPTDDKNWGIAATPVPDIGQNVGQVGQPALMGIQPRPDLVGNQPDTDSAKAAAVLMEREIDDQFKESRFNASARRVIEDGCIIGTGVLKGPIVSDKRKAAWGVAEDGPSSGTFVRAESPDPAPVYLRVDPWSFFPDMSATTVDDAEFFFERHFMTPKQMRALARVPGFSADTIQDLLEADATEDSPGYMAELRSLAGLPTAQSPRYEVWEYHGELDADDLALAGLASGKMSVLDTMRVIVWFCGDKVLKFGECMLDSEEPVYSVFCLEEDPASIFGVGVPHLMRDSQSALNASWRMALDNLGMSACPQIVVDKSKITPVNGSYDLRPWGVWEKKGDGQDSRPAIDVLQIDARFVELQQVIALATKFADDETSLPLVSQGESGVHQTQTAHGMAMLMGSANVIFRRVVQNYDDNITTPLVRRAFDWNMQFSKREDIKGDFAVVARGSSVLLVREMQAHNLMAMALHFSAHPILGPLTKTAALYRELVKAHMLSEDTIVKTDEEISREQQAAEQAAQQAAEQAAQQAAQQGAPEQDPIAQREQTRLQIAQIERDSRIQVAEIQRAIAEMRTQHEHEHNQQKLSADVAGKGAVLAHKERTLAVEVAEAMRTGKGSGGSV